MSYELQPFMSTAPPPTPRGGAQGQPTGPAQQIQRCMKAQSQIQVTIQRSLASCRELDERFLAAQKRADESAVAYLQSQPDENDLELGRLPEALDGTEQGTHWNNKTLIRPPPTY